MDADLEKNSCLLFFFFFFLKKQPCFKPLNLIRFLLFVFSRLDNKKGNIDLQLARFMLHSLNISSSELRGDL